MPIAPMEAFYASLPLLHAIGGILAISLCFACDTGRGIQTARIPRAMPLPDGLTKRAAFLTSYPWDQGAPFKTHDWNPFLLIFVFEWITAAFALRTLQYYTSHPWMVVQFQIIWLSIGILLAVTWSITNSGDYCTAMICTTVASFIVSAFVCAWYGMQKTNMQAMLTLRPKNVTPAKHHTDPLTGRIWIIPTVLRNRKNGHSLLIGQDGTDDSTGMVDYDYENSTGVYIRYMEYCITAPLLFLAVVCFLTTDAPAWLFLTGYWLLFVCNAVGVALHACFQMDMQPLTPENGGLMAWLTFLLFSDSWRSSKSNRLCLLQTAWISLLVPMCGLIFITRQYLFSTDMPALVLFLIWNLLVTYSLFGILPTFIYLSGKGTLFFSFVLDILNIAAKFPLPLVILSGFITRPATNRFCF